MDKRVRFNLMKDDKLMYRINGVLEYDEANQYDDGELKFIHPMTGELYNNPKRCLEGWSSQNEETEQSRWTLADMICEDTDLMQKAWDLDTINYYL